MGAQKSKSQQPTTGRKGTGPADLTKINARIDRVKVSGLHRTHDDYVQQAVRNCFQAHTFKEVLEEVGRTRVGLEELRAFKDVHAKIDVSRGTDATPNGYEVTFEGQELSRLVGTIGTEIGNNEGSLTAQLSAPNVLGRGESVTLNGSYSNCKSTDLNLKLTKPFLHTSLSAYKPEISFSVFRTSNPLPWFRCNTHDVGLLLDYSFRLPFNVQHSLQYSLEIRELAGTAKQLPFSVREHFGPRQASILRHICAYDQRDNRIFPRTGIFVQMTNELSGPGGNIKYVKNNTHAEVNMPLFAGLSAQITGRVGLIQTDKLDEPIPLSSLFILGGPLTVRGFQMAGIGDHAEGAALGAHSYWATGLHLWSPLPFNRHFGGFADLFRVHGFATLGNTNNFSLEGVRYSVGAGLAVRIGDRARIELNYCKPVLVGPTDIAQKEGFQFGIGYEFL